MSSLMLLDKVLITVGQYLHQLAKIVDVAKPINLRRLPQSLTTTLPSGVKITVYYEQSITEQISNQTFKFTGILAQHPDLTKIYYHLNINLGLGELRSGSSLFGFDIYQNMQGHGRAIKIIAIEGPPPFASLLVINFSPVDKNMASSCRADVVSQVYLDLVNQYYKCIVPDLIAESLWLIHALKAETERIISYDLYLQNFPYSFGSKLGSIPEQEAQLNINTQLLRFTARPRQEGPAQIIYETDGGPRSINKELINLYLIRTKLSNLQAEFVLQEIYTSKVGLIIDIESYYKKTFDPLMKYFN